MALLQPVSPNVALPPATVNIWLIIGDRRVVELGMRDAAGLAMPKEAAFRSTGKHGVHSEHMGYILAEMQHLQRTFPGGVW